MAVVLLSPLRGRLCTAVKDTRPLEQKRLRLHREGLCGYSLSPQKKKKRVKKRLHFVAWVLKCIFYLRRGTVPLNRAFEGLNVRGLLNGRTLSLLL